jgi:hypothetical protein
MNHTDQNLLVPYLLGSLSAAETERLDELSIGDDEFAAALQAAETQLNDAYVNGELSAPDRTAFEAHYLKSPHRREQALFARAFQVWTSNETAGAVESDRAVPAVSNVTPMMAPRIKRPSHWTWALAAAAILFVLVGGFLVIRSIRTSRQAAADEARRQELTRPQASPVPPGENPPLVEVPNRSPQPTPTEPAPKTPAPAPTSEPVIATLVLAAPVRGGGAIPTVRSNAGRINARLELDPAANFPLYKVALIDPASTTILWESGLLNGRGQSSLNIVFPAQTLTAKIYQLRVTGLTIDSGTEIIGNYPFEIVK